MARFDTVGSKLRRARESNGLDLDGLAKAIKVGVHLLEALESNQFNRLPGGPFNKGFVRAYARHVGLDAEATVLAYAREERSQGLSSPDADKARRWDFSHLMMFRIEENRKTLVLDWLALRAVLVGILAVLVGILAVGILIIGGWNLYRIGWAETTALSAARPDTGAGTAASSPAAEATADALPAMPAAEKPVSPAEPGQATRAAGARTTPAESAPSSAFGPQGAGDASRSSSDGSGLVSGPTPLGRTTRLMPAGHSRLLVAESAVGTAVLDRVLVGSGDRFEAGSRVFFWTRTLEGRQGDPIRHVWLHEGRPVVSHDLRIGGPHWRNFSRHTLPEHGIGAWAVEARDADDRLLARQTFVCIARSRM